MEVKENVGVEVSQTDLGAKAQDGADKGQTPSQVSTVWEKFKDADALAKAYGALQSEFTRRSQKLKELEREMENLKAVERAEKAVKENGAEKLKDRMAVKRAERKQFDQFVHELERTRSGAENVDNAVEPVLTNAKADDEGPSAENVQSQSVGIVAENTLDYGNTGAAVGTENETVENIDELYEKAARNESVRRKIIGEYLSSLNKNGAPLMRGGTGAFAAPPMRAKSIDEAGNMALRFFQKT
ncbi:MAG: hypothetical protein IJA89_02625 [Clostridia bacterium]|nr:hypothetical protein [Clostridia bacterium]